MVSFDCSLLESRLLTKIAQRAVTLAKAHGLDLPFSDMEMDLTACHCNGCPLDLERLLEATDSNFGHDVFGIRKHLDRTTGELTNCFVPRFAEREVATGTRGA